MYGGLMQLVAYGAQDRFLTGNSSVRRYSPPSRLTTSVTPEQHDNILYLTEDLIEIDRYEECIISLEQIQNNENIAKCSQCKKIVKYNIMQQWFNENESCPHCRGEYPETTFLCGKAQIQSSFLETSRAKNQDKKHNLEEQDNESPCNKKAKLI